MKYTYEERDRLVSEYSQRTGKNKEIVSEMFAFDKLIEKYGSKGESYLVENPDMINESEKKRKIRRKNTHLIPKKKKRK